MERSRRRTGHQADARRLEPIPAAVSGLLGKRCLGARDTSEQLAELAHQLTPRLPAKTNPLQDRSQRRGNAAPAFSASAVGPSSQSTSSKHAAASAKNLYHWHEMLLPEAPRVFLVSTVPPAQASGPGRANTLARPRFGPRGVTCFFRLASACSERIRLLGRRKVARFGSFRHAGSDRIQVHIRTTSQNRHVVDQLLCLESSLPKSARTLVFLVCPTRDYLGQAAHDPADIAQTPPLLLAVFGCTQDHFQIVLGRLSRTTIFLASFGKQPPPPHGHFFIAPHFHDIWPISEDHMEVIPHDGEPQEIDPKDPGQLFTTIANPLSSMLVRFAGDRVFSAEHRAPDRTLHAVEDGNFPWAKDSRSDFALPSVVLLSSDEPAGVNIHRSNFPSQEFGWPY